MELTTSWKEEGILIGRQRAVQDVIIRQLRRRVGRVTPDLEQAIRLLPTAQAEELTDALFDFKSIAEAEAWVAAHGS